MAIITILSLPKGCNTIPQQNKADTVRVEKVDTMFVQDTAYITIDKPLLVKETKYKTIKDTLYTTDSIPVMVDVPITTKTYEGIEFARDSTKVSYVANVSGYKSSLDTLTLKIESERPVITHTITETITKTKTKHWGYGINTSVGYGLINKRPDIFIGVGFQYNF